jgi:hypothetical protein
MPLTSFYQGCVVSQPYLPPGVPKSARCVIVLNQRCYLIIKNLTLNNIARNQCQRVTAHDVHKFDFSSATCELLGSSILRSCLEGRVIMRPSALRNGSWLQHSASMGHRTVQQGVRKPGRGDMRGWRARHPRRLSTSATVHLAMRAQHAMEVGLTGDVDTCSEPQSSAAPIDDRSCPH